MSKVLYRQFDGIVLFECIPVSFSFKEGGGALPFEFSQVFQMGHTVVHLEEFERFTGGKIIALPAALEFLLSVTLSYLAIRWPAIASEIT